MSTEETQVEEQLVNQTEEQVTEQATETTEVIPQQMEGWEQVNLNEAMAQRSQSSPELMMLIQMQQQFMQQQAEFNKQLIEKIGGNKSEEVSQEEPNYIADAANTLLNAHTVDLYRVEYNGSGDNAAYKRTVMQKFYSKKEANEYAIQKYGTAYENKTWRITVAKTILDDQEYNDLVNNK